MGFSKRDRGERLNEGDHVYSWRAGGLYAHHGIFMGDNRVISFTANDGRGSTFVSMSFDPLELSEPNPPLCPICAIDPASPHGVVSSCLSCFLRGGPLHRYRYGVHAFVSFFSRPGTCTQMAEDPVNQTRHRAIYLLNHGFRSYRLLRRNCEDFAIYCKTGKIAISGYVGLSGQSRLCCSLLLIGLHGILLVLMLTGAVPPFACLSLHIQLARFAMNGMPVVVEIEVEDLVQELAARDVLESGLWQAFFAYLTAYFTAIESRMPETLARLQSLWGVTMAQQMRIAH